MWLPKYLRVWCFKDASYFQPFQNISLIEREKKSFEKNKLPTSTNYQNQAMYPFTAWFQPSTPTTPFWNPVDIWLELAWLASSSCRSCSKSARDLRLTRFAFHLAATGIRKKCGMTRIKSSCTFDWEANGSQGSNLSTSIWNITRAFLFWYSLRFLNKISRTKFAVIILQSPRP